MKKKRSRYIVRKEHGQARRTKAKKAKTIRRFLSTELLEDRALLAGDLLYHNVDRPADVNADGKVDVSDVMAVVGALRSMGPISLNSFVSSAQAPNGNGAEGEPSPLYIDVDGDEFLSTQDALAVVQAIRAEGAPGDQVIFTLQPVNAVAFEDFGTTGADAVTLGLEAKEGGGPITFTFFAGAAGSGPAFFGPLPTPGTRSFSIILNDATVGSLAALINGNAVAGALVNAFPESGNPATILRNTVPPFPATVDVNLLTPIASVEQGDSFFVNFSAQDTRPPIIGQPRGVQAFSLNIAFDNTRVLFSDDDDPGDPLLDQLFNDYLNLTPVIPDGGADNLAGLIKKFRGFSFVEQGGASVFAWTFEFTADALRPQNDAFAVVDSTGAPLLEDQGPFVFNVLMNDSLNTGAANFTGQNDTSPGGAVELEGGVTANVGDIDFGATSVNVTGGTVTLVGVQTTTDRGGTASIDTLGNMNPSDDVVLYTPPAEFNSLDTGMVDRFTYTVSDGLGLTKTATVTVVVSEVNDAPTAVDDGGAFFTTAEDTPKSFSLSTVLTQVFLNDSPGPAFEPSSQTLEIINFNGQTADFFTTTGSRGGTIQITDAGAPGPDGADLVTYTPAMNFNGVETFFYVIADDGTTNGSPNSLSATATISITVTAVNDPPEVLGETETAAEDMPRTFSVTALLSNDEPGPTAPAGTVDDESGQTLSLSLPSSSTQRGGTVTLNDNGTPGDPNDDFVVYTPAGDFNTFDSGLTDTFTYVVSDNGVPVATATATVTVSVTEMNDPPVAGPDGGAFFTTDESIPKSFSLSTVLAQILLNDSPGPAQEANTQSLEVIDFNGETGDFFMTTGSAGGTITVSDAGAPGSSGDDLVVYTPPSMDFSGTETFFYIIQDNGTNNGTPAPLTAMGVISVTVTGVNDAPTLANIEPAALPYTENDPATIVTSQLVVDDVDNANLVGATVQITSGYVSGQDVLSLTGAPVSGTFNPATGTLTLTGSASLADYQAALRLVRYQNTSDNPSTASRVISFQVNDGQAANNLSNVATRTISVTAENDAPTLSGIEVLSLEYDENEPATQVSGTISISDPDDTMIESAVVQITGNYQNGQDILGLLAALPGGISAGAGFNPATGSITLTGSASLSDYITALRNVSYSNNSDNPSSLLRTVSFTVNDGEADSNVATRTINVIPENDAPTLAGIEAAPLPYTENDAATIVTSQITVSDVDSTSLIGGAVQITSGYVSGEDVLSLSGAPVSGTFNPATGILTLSGSASLADYQAALRLVRYQNTSDNPSTANRVVSFQVNDGGAVDNLSNVATRTISITAVNDRPVVDLDDDNSGGVSGNDFRNTFTEDLGAVLIADPADATVSDVDSPALASLTITNLDLVDAGAEILAADPGVLASTGISAMFSGSTLTLTGPATPAQFAQVLRTVTYNNTSQNPTAGTRRLEVVANDGATMFNVNMPPATSTITVVAVNDAPEVDLNGAAAGTGFTAAFTEGDAPVNIADPAAATVMDVDSPTLASMTFTIVGLQDAGAEVLTFDTSGTTISANFAGGVLTLTGAASSPSQFQQVLRTVRYENSSQNPTPGVRTINVVTNDGAAANNTTTVVSSVTVVAVNDPPVVDAADTTVFVQGLPAVPVDAAATITDVDGTTLVSVSVEISMNFTSGQDALSVLNPGMIPASINAVVVGNGQRVELTPSMGQPNASLADFQTALRQIGYSNNTPVPAIVADPRQVTILANDGNAANSVGGDIVTVLVAPPRLPLALPNLNLEVVEDSGANPFDVTSDDIVSIGGNAQITGLLADGETDVGLQMDVLNTPRGVVTISPDGKSIIFTPNSDEFTPAAGPLERFQYVLDDGVAGNDGPDRGQVSVRIRPQNDAPTLTAIGPQQTNEDAELVVNLAGIGSGAANETQTLTVTATSDNPTLVPNTAFNLEVSYMSANPTGTLTIRPAPNLPTDFVAQTATITVRVMDNGGTLDGGVNSFSQMFTLTVNPINDAPTLDAIDSLEINEDASTQTVDLTGITAGGGETQNLTVTATSNMPGLIPDPVMVNYTGGSTGSLSFTPVADQHGTATVTVTVMDDGPTGGEHLNSFQRSFTVVVNPVNDQPTLDVIPDPAPILEDAAQQTVNLNGIGTGAANENQMLTVTAVSDSPGLISTVTVNYINGETTGTLNYTPVGNQNGTATITVTVMDDGGTDRGGVNVRQRSFTVTVVAVNDAPTLDAIGTQTVGEDSGPHSVGLTGITAGPSNETQALTVTAESDNPTLIPHPTIVYTSPGSTGTLQYSPVANQTGMAEIVVTVMDNGGTDNAGVNTFEQTFVISVIDVNDAPTLDQLDDLTIDEDAPLQSVDLSGITTGAANEFTQTLTVTAVSDNPGLIPNPTVTYSPNDPTGSISFTPVAEANTPANGVAVITVTVMDNGGTAAGGVDTFQRVFTVTVNEVNDAPTAVDDNVSAVEDTPTIFMNAALTGNDVRGPANESGQAMVVTSVSAASAQGGTVSVDASGNVTYTPPSDFNTTFAGVFDTFTYLATDNGTTAGANNPLPTTNTGTVTVSISEVNDPPELADDELTRTIDEDPAAPLSISFADILSESGATTGSPGAVAFDEGSQTLSVGINSATSFWGGSVSINGMNIEYQPLANFNGVDSFAFVITDNGTTAGASDPRGVTGTVSVTVNAVNDAPITFTRTDLTAISGQGSQGPFDPLGGPMPDLKGPLAPPGTLDDETGQMLTVDSVMVTSGGGTATLNPDGLTFSYDPGSFVGTAIVSYVVRDNGTPSRTANGTAEINVIEFEPSTFSGFVYHDRNSNGVKDGNEEGFAGVTVTLEGLDDFGGAVMTQMTTSADGFYQFSGLRPGEYDVWIEAMPHLRDGVETIYTPGTGAATPGFGQFSVTLNGLDRVRTDMNLLGGYHLRADFAKLGLEARFISIWDFTAGAGGSNIVFGLDAAGSLMWHEFGTGWDGFVRADFQFTSPDRTTAQLTVVKRNADNSETTYVINLNSTQFRIKGTTTEGTVIQLLGGASTWGLTSVELPDGEPPATAEEALQQSPAEAEFIPSEEQLAATLPAGFATDVQSLAPPSLMELLAAIVASPEARGPAAQTNVNTRDAGTRNAEREFPADYDYTTARAEQIAQEMADSPSEFGAEFVEALDAVFGAGGDLFA